VVAVVVLIIIQQALGVQAAAVKVAVEIVQDLRVQET